MSMSRALVKRGRGALGRPRRKRRKNPAGEPSWGWLFSGIGLGAVSVFSYEALGPPSQGTTKPSAAVVASDSLAGAGGGMLLAGIVGGIWGKNPATAAVGVIGGLAMFTVGTVLVVQKMVT
jgi:hypothetical protein